MSAIDILLGLLPGMRKVGIYLEAPTNLQVSYDLSSTVTVTWSTGANLDTTSYVVERSDDDGNTWSALAETLPAASSYNDATAGPPDGTEVYRYRVKPKAGGSIGSASIPSDPIGPGLYEHGFYFLYPDVNLSASGSADYIGANRIWQIPPTANGVCCAFGFEVTKTNLLEWRPDIPSGTFDHMATYHVGSNYPGGGWCDSIGISLRDGTPYPEEDIRADFFPGYQTNTQIIRITNHWYPGQTVAWRFVAKTGSGVGSYTIDNLRVLTYGWHLVGT